MTFLESVARSVGRPARLLASRSAIPCNCPAPPAPACPCLAPLLVRCCPRRPRPARPALPIPPPAAQLEIDFQASRVGAERYSADPSDTSVSPTILDTRPFKDGCRNAPCLISERLGGSAWARRSEAFYTALGPIIRNAITSAESNPYYDKVIAKLSTHDLVIKDLRWSGLRARATTSSLSCRVLTGM